MASTAVSTVLSKFGELALSEGKLLLEVGDKMVLLRDRLEWLQASIREADRKRRIGTDGLSRVWLRQTRDVAFQVEDALDEFFHQVDLESQGYHGWRKWGKFFAGCWTQITVRHVLSARLDKINCRLEQISENQKEYNIEHTPSSVTLASSTTTTAAAWQDERNDMVGFEEDVKTLQGFLLREDHPETMFISIIGESGVGKKTLADALFEKTPAGEGKLKFVAIIPPDSWAEDTVHTLYSSLLLKGNEDIGKEEEDQAAEEAVIVDQASRVRGYLSDVTYMVFLSGITSITMLNLLITCLPNNRRGSSVVLVLDSANEEVALHAQNLNEPGINGIHLVTRLDEERSGELFRSRALRKKGEAAAGGKEEYEEANNKKKKLYNKTVFGITGGHGLSLVLLGGLLRFKERPLQWEVLLQQLIMPGMMPMRRRDELQEEEGEGDQEQEEHRAKLTPASTSMERIFWASFEDLPNDIKSCFLYLVIFGRNTEVNVETIVGVWIGEGFIKPHKGETMEDRGQRYVKELALRCLVQVQSRCWEGGIEAVMVHSSLHGFLQSEAREAGFLEVHDIHNVFVPPSARRLSFQINGGRNTRFNNKFPKLRSFICVDIQQGSTAAGPPGAGAGAEKKLVYDLKFLLGSKFLRVLVLGGQRIEEVPEEIGNLLELRYIYIDSQEFKELPSSIRRLLNLQTLKIIGTQVHTIHPGFWKIKTLRHVIASNLTLPESLEGDQLLLGELQTLTGVTPPQEQTWSVANCPLRRMTKLQTLDLQGIQHHYHGAALEAALQDSMHLLVRVTLRGDLLPSCVYTAANNLRLLEAIQLAGRVDWPQATLNSRMLRPNLRLVAFDPLEDVPQHIMDELRWVG